jgi:hypothetical protein
LAGAVWVSAGGGAVGVVDEGSLPAGGGGVGVVDGGFEGAGAGVPGSLEAGPTTHGRPSTRKPLGGQSGLTTTFGMGSPSVEPAGAAPTRKAKAPAAIAEVVTCERTTAHAPER